jgi:hypothetical protein
MTSHGRGNATGYIQISVNLKSDKIENERQKLKETVTTIQAMLNSEGGKVKLYFTNPKETSRLINVSRTKIMRSFTRKIEQYLIGTAGIQTTSANINLKQYINKIIVEVKRAYVMTIQSYNIFLPTETQVVLVSPLEPLQRINDAILRREVVRNATKLGSHCKRFVKRKDCRLREGKSVQVKSLKSISSKCTTLADRMTSKGNKFSHYVSAFANYKGGNIYYGVTDDGIVEGEWIPNADSIPDITKKVEKPINKMVWPQQIGQPKRGVHWEIFFEPVGDENSEVIPSTFVIAIYISPCLGGVFTEEPECYEMVESKVKKMPFLTLKKKALKLDEADRKEEIPGTVQRITWSSAGTERRCTKTDIYLMEAINNAQWTLFSKGAEYFEETFPEYVEIQLIVLSKRIITWCRRSYFGIAKHLLDKFYQTLPTSAKDTTIFEAIGLYLEIALQRAQGNLIMDILAGALSMVELIPQGIISASLLVLVATSSTMGNDQQRNQVSPKVLCEKALEHLQNVQKPNVVKTDLERKAHINLAQQQLGCSFSENSVSKDLKDVDLDRAKSSITVVEQSIADEGALACYREIQLNNVLSILNYRYSQVHNDQSTHYLKEALNNCRKAKRRAEDCQFQEMIEWAKICEGLFTEELMRAYFRKRVDANTY